MVQYCRKCGEKLDDDAEFCDSCGFKLNESPIEKKESKNQTQHEKIEFVTRLPLILAIISIIIAIAEGLGTPMLMGWTNILSAMGVGVVGSIIGIILMEKLDEPMIAAIEFIATGALIFMFIGRFGEISAALLIITAVLTLYFKGYHVKSRKLYAIPILTFVLIFALLIISGVVYQINAEDSIEVGNITQDIKYDGYGYYDGHVMGDIYVGTNFDYLEVTVNYYDSQNKVLYSGIGWNELHPESGKTYKFDSMYFDEQAPVKAEIKVVDSASSTTPLYTENITLNN